MDSQRGSNRTDSRATFGRLPLPARRLATAGVLTIPLFALGCKVGPDYAHPEVALNEAWTAQHGAEAAPVNAAWWESFNDPTLSSLVSSSLSQNLGLRVAGLRVIEARAARGIAVGQFFPQVQQAVGSIGANNVSANGAPNSGDRNFGSASVGLEAAWELDFWGKFRRGIEAADSEVLASVADYDAVLVSLAGDVATNYILVRSLQERLVYAKSNVALQDETLALTQARFKAGAVSELDVSTARATLANTRATIPDLENSLRQTKLALCILLGRTPADLESELAPTAPLTETVPIAPTVIATGIPAELLRRRPDVRSAERQAAAQSARIGEAVSDLYPRISITGSTAFVSSTYNGEKHSQLSNIFDANSFAGFVGLQVNWPILNYGRIRNNIRVQDARYEEAVAGYQDSVLRAAADVEAGLSEFLRSRERATDLTEAVDASQRSVDLSLIQYRAGAVDFIRVNTAQTALVQEQDTLVTARAAIALGAVHTYRALGGGWEIRGDGEFVDEGTAKRMQDTTEWGDVLKKDWPQGRDLGFTRPEHDQGTDNK